MAVKNNAAWAIAGALGLQNILLATWMLLWAIDNLMEAQP